MLSSVSLVKTLDKAFNTASIPVKLMNFGGANRIDYDYSYAVYALNAFDIIKAETVPADKEHLNVRLTLVNHSVGKNCTSVYQLPVNNNKMFADTLKTFLMGCTCCG